MWKKKADKMRIKTDESEVKWHAKQLICWNSCSIKLTEKWKTFIRHSFTSIIILPNSIHFRQNTDLKSKLKNLLSVRRHFKAALIGCHTSFKIHFKSFKKFNVFLELYFAKTSNFKDVAVSMISKWMRWKKVIQYAILTRQT